jgi:DNA-directed RNA polymerase subunit omega
MSSISSRYTSEKAVDKVGNRFDLVLIASLRVRELTTGHRTKLTDLGTNKDDMPKPMTIALREIEEGLVGREYLERYRNSDRQRKKNSDRYTDL